MRICIKLQLNLLADTFSFFVFIFSQQFYFDFIHALIFFLFAFALTTAPALFVKSMLTKIIGFTHRKVAVKWKRNCCYWCDGWEGSSGTSASRCANKAVPIAVIIQSPVCHLSIGFAHATTPNCNYILIISHKLHHYFYAFHLLFLFLYFI